jgi:hypothetical protein
LVEGVIEVYWIGLVDLDSDCPRPPPVLAISLQVDTVDVSQLQVRLERYLLTG